LVSRRIPTTNFITFLAQSALPGLEVRTAEGEWIRPPAFPGTFVVNTGAMLARYSNDRFKATNAPGRQSHDKSRYAIPFFLGPNHDAVVDARPDLHRPPTPPRYEANHLRRFHERLLTLNFALRRGEEPAR
jgi:isopenicillin N synthase-like dioxygenase